MVQILPGDVATQVLGRYAPEVARAQLRLQLHLDQPLIVRYFDWLGQLLVGNLGNALSSQRPISQILPTRLSNTLILSATALAIYLPITLTIATLQAFYRNRTFDHLLSTVTLVLASTPDFLLSLLLLVAFVIEIPILPAVSDVGVDTSFLGWIRALILPAFTLAISMAVYGIRMLRDNLIDVLESEFIQIALLRGLTPRRVLLRHALPNALIPTINVTALNLAYLIGGVVIVEKVFAFPGFGTLMIDAVSFRDVPLVQITVLLASVVYVIANFAADVMAIILNPKLRGSTTGS
jgi:peptide/nickel transport system permease protein